MNSKFRDNIIQSQDWQTTIDSLQQTTSMITQAAPGVYVYKPLGYASSFEKVPVLIPDVATPVTHLVGKRKSVSTQTARDNDTLEHFHASKNHKKEQPVQRRPSFYQVDPLDFVNSLNSLDFLDLLKSLKSMDASDFLGCEDVDLHCYENAEEIFEDIDMKKQLREMTALPVRKHTVDDVSSELMYPSFQHWGTDESPFAHSISQLY
jgi:hypothetical protein